MAGEVAQQGNRHVGGGRKKVGRSQHPREQGRAGRGQGNREAMCGRWEAGKGGARHGQQPGPGEGTRNNVTK